MSAQRAAAILCTLAAFAVPAVAGEAIVSARFVEPTQAYGHGAIAQGEHAALEAGIRGDDGTRRRLRIAIPGAVFEDTAPRLADLDGDGSPEILTVSSSLNDGARIAVIGAGDGALALRALSAPAGQPHRWFAILGAADLDGDGATEIAFVDRPHLDRVLRILRVRPAPDGWRLDPVAALPGFTAHRLGAAGIVGGIRDCGQGPEIVLPAGDWRATAILRLDAGRIVAVRHLAGADPGAVAAALACRNG